LTTDVIVVHMCETKVEANALITTINPNGEWHGITDNAITSCSGQMFHDQARAEMPLVDGQVVYYAPEQGSHSGKFDGVLFAVDDHSRSLYDVVYAALVAAAQLDLRTVSIPCPRLSLRMDEVTRRRALGDLARAINDFVEIHDGIDEIKVVAASHQDQRILFTACATRSRVRQH